MVSLPRTSDALDSVFGESADAWAPGSSAPAGATGACEWTARSAGSGCPELALRAIAAAVEIGLVAILDPVVAARG